MADVHVPGLGKMKKGYVFAIAGGGVIVVYYIYKHQKASSAAANAAAAVPATTGTVYPTGQGDGTVGNPNDPNSIDPATGMTYGEEAAEGMSTGYGGTAYGDTAIDSSTGTDSTSTAPTTNAAWANQVETTLTNIGYAPTDVSGAVGRYLSNLSLTATQAGIIQVALAEDGPPPQGSYTMITTGDSAPVTTTTGTGTTSSGTPNAPYARATAEATNSITLAATGGFNSYTVRYSANYGSWTHNFPSGNITVGALRSKTTFTFAVAGTYKGVMSPYSPSFTATTK